MPLPARIIEVFEGVAEEYWPRAMERPYWRVRAPMGGGLSDEGFKTLLQRCAGKTIRIEVWDEPPPEAKKP